MKPFRSDLKDMTGQRFGILTALKPLRRGPDIYWLVKCDCGTEKEVKAYSLRGGKTKNCGCQKGFNWRTHGMNGTRTHRTWNSMKARCYSEGNASYPSYGAKGITVCRRWHKFENFIADMGACPSDKHTIDRIDNKRNYTPKNCRWATVKEQANNRKTNAYVTHKGQTMTLRQVADMELLHYRSFRYYFRTGKTVEEAILAARKQR